ncbi:MAG: hypothetical protein AAFQ07_19675, partial [Chloroflexota bacterium]
SEIHEFVFTGGSDAGLENFFEIARDLLDASKPEDTMRYIIDTTQSTTNNQMGKLVRGFRKLEAQVGERAAGRTVILHDGSVLLSLADTFLSTLAPAKDKTRFFTADERESAIAWLLSG